ncbi:MAG: hypothetical protein AAF703_05235 [Cyanobacteria bacterium P01_D01_bin.105]
MSISELNHFMTYVIEGWMLFSAGFISTTFIAFVSKRMQEDIAAAELAALQATEQTNEEIESARLEEVAAVSEQLAQTKEKNKQSGTSSVSVST